MKKLEIKLTIVSILFLIFLPISVHALPYEAENLFDNSEKNLILDSKIIDIDSDFFIENNFKRYLIFGSTTLPDNVLKNNSIYSVQSNYGFFSISLLSEVTASNLISQGYYVIEDSKLDFHNSEKIIPDVSRIGDITGSNIAKQKYNSTGNDIVIAVVDTGVDF